MGERRKPLRWRVAKREWMTAPEMHDLHRGGVRLATVQEHSSGRGYFWYGQGKNTAGEPPQTLEEAKAAAVAHVKATEVPHA